MWYWLGPLLAFVAIVLAVRYFRNHKYLKGIRIENPAIKLIYFSGDEKSKELAGFDRGIYDSYYKNVSIKEVGGITELRDLLAAEKCDLLHLYLDLDNHGNAVDPEVTGLHYSDFLEELSHAGVSYVFFAKDNSEESLSAGTKSERQKVFPNAVLVIDRKDTYFEVFFKLMFEQISAGMIMPLAWNKLSPQIPDEFKKDQIAPVCLAMMGNAQVILMGDKEQ